MISCQRQFLFHPHKISETKVSEEQWHFEKLRLTIVRGWTKSDYQLTRSDGKPGEHDDDGREGGVDVDGCCLALGGSGAALPN